MDQKNNLRQPKIYRLQDIGYANSQTSKKKLPKFLLLLILFLAILSGLGYLFFYLSIFKIKNIIIEGVPLKTAIFENLKGRNILTIDSSEIKTIFSQNYPEINIVKISRGLPATLKIKLKERPAKILWQSQGKTYLVDSSGNIFREIEGVTGLPTVKDNKDLTVVLEHPVVTENFINFITDISSNINPKTGLVIDFFAVNETIFQVEGQTNLGWKIIFDTTRLAQDQLADLAIFLKDHQNEIKDYADVRVEGRVYYQ